MLHVFIINPASGKNKGIKIGEAIKEHCESLGIDYLIHYTKHIGEATFFASLYKTNPNAIIYSVGGDGTINEIVNGMSQSSAFLSIIPAGTGNDFYKTLKEFSGDKIDLCKVNDKYFINIASIGLDAEVADLANTLKYKKLPNKLVYILSLIKTFFTYKSKEVTIDGNDKKITILTICNGKYYGGGFKIDPKAKLNSGKLDIIEAKDMNKFKILKLLTKLPSGKHLSSNLVLFNEESNIKIKSNKPLVCNIDGEIIKSTIFDFSIEKGAINYKEDNIGINEYLKEKKLIK